MRKENCKSATKTPKHKKKAHESFRGSVFLCFGVFVAHQYLPFFAFFASAIFVVDSRGKIYNHVVVDSLSATIAAVADPTRRAIMNRLAEGPAPVRDIAKPFRMSQQAISKHLAYLEKAQLIEKHRVGRLHICSLKPQPLQELAEWAEGYRKLWEANYERLDNLLEELKRDQTENPDKG